MKKILCSLIIACSLVNFGFSQNDLSIGLRYGGLSFQEWHLSNGNIELNGQTQGRFYLGTYAKKEIGKNYSLGLGIDYMAANEQVSFRFSGGAGRYRYSIVSISPNISKNIIILKNKIGLHLGMSFPISYFNTNSFNYTDDGSFRVIWINVKDNNGNLTLVPKYDLVFSGEREVERNSSFYIRPEIGLFYIVSDKVKITLNHMRGFNPGKPMIFRNLDPIVYDHENFWATDFFEGNYRSTSIGIEFKIK